MDRKEQVYSYFNDRPCNLQTMLLKNRDIERIAHEDTKEVVSLLPPLEGKKVLEFAAGIGRFTTPLAEKALHVTAVDLVPKFIQENRQKNDKFSNISFQIEDATEFSSEKESFDVIFINWLFVYLEDKEVELLAKKCRLWLKSGGHLFIRESCSASGRVVRDGYYANYRSLFYYTKLFDEHFTRIKQDSIQIYEREFSNPFQCYWLYQKS